MTKTRAGDIRRVETGYVLSEQVGEIRKKNDRRVKGIREG